MADIVSDELAKFTPTERAVLAQLAKSSGDVWSHDLYTQIEKSVSGDEWHAMVAKFRATPLVIVTDPSAIRPRQYFRVDPLYRDALATALNA